MSFLGALLSRRDWVYSLSLLVPFVVYDLALKTASLLSQPGLYWTFGLVRSNVFFDLGYVLIWLGLFAATRGGHSRRVVVILFHVVTTLVVVMISCAHAYYQQTGTTLDFEVIALWIPEFREVIPILTHGVPLSAWVLLVISLTHAALGPLVITRAMDRWRGGRPRGEGRPRASFLGAIGLWLLALGFGFLSLTINSGPSGASKSFVMDPLVNMALTGVKEATAAEANPDTGVAGPAIEHPAASASLAETSRTEKRNVVLIHLESTRQRAITPYNKGLDTTPFLDELAKNSLVADRDYTTVPHTSKASVSVNCGIEPHLVQPTTEASPDGIPVPCLAGLLKDQGYSSALFQSSTKDFEDFEGLAKNFGYDDYYPLESMDTTGFEQTNYFGYEDDIMLEPSKQWLEGHKDGPFMAEYLLGTGHHDYQCSSLRSGYEEFTGNEPVNSYLNCIRYQDFFVKNLIDQYKKLGLYDNTIFVIYGDHGEGFGEHGLYIHDDTIYEEGLKVPLIIHAPGLLDKGQRIEEPTNHTDILPTVLDLLGYKVQGGEYPGYSLPRPVPEDRTLFFSCFHEEQCLASIQGNEKYIYHYDNQPDELFNLSKDPNEQQNLADERGQEALDERRKDLFEWYSGVNATYGPVAKP